MNAAYTRAMKGVDDQAAPAPQSSAKVDAPAPVSDRISQLSAVYRNYPGLRALILRRVRDPEVAADILQDAAVTTLEKLRNGEIAHPENLGGYLYRELLIRCYLNDEDKDYICRTLHLSHEHFNRVIFRARNRLKELLEQHGYGKADLLTIVAISLCLSTNGSGIPGTAHSMGGWNAVSGETNAAQGE